jgi:hypothetical protein
MGSMRRRGLIGPISPMPPVVPVTTSLLPSRERLPEKLLTLVGLEDFSDYLDFNESSGKANSDNPAVYEWALEAPLTSPPC